MTEAAPPLPRHNLLHEPLITVEDDRGATRARSLPGVLAALAGNRVGTFTHLRPHQAPAWHVFLVQLAALGLLRNHRLPLPIPGEPDPWRKLLRGLTPPPNGAPEPDRDAPWQLLAPPHLPAFLQPPVDPAGKSGAACLTPDSIDVLPAARNHDLKQHTIGDARAEHWIFALVSAQTQGGYMGSGKYGIARMHGGFGNRTFCSLEPAGAAPGQRFRHHLSVLLARRDELAAAAARAGVGTDPDPHRLLWTLPWNGREALRPERMHPLAVEACRRLRLQQGGKGLTAAETAAKNTRIAAADRHGAMGDPWTPILDADAPKAFNIGARGFPYTTVAELLFGSDRRRWRLPLLATNSPGPAAGLDLVIEGLARGKGKVEGFHTRRVPIPAAAAAAVVTQNSELAARARRRVEAAAVAASRCLRPALILLVQGGPDTADWGKPTNDPFTAHWTAAFSRAVDDAFFPALWESLETDPDNGDNPDGGGKRDEDAAWRQFLQRSARRILNEAVPAAPCHGHRRTLAGARAHNLLAGACRRHLAEQAPTPGADPA